MGPLRQQALDVSNANGLEHDDNDDAEKKNIPGGTATTESCDVNNNEESSSRIIDCSIARVEATVTTSASLSMPTRHARTATTTTTATAGFGNATLAWDRTTPWFAKLLIPLLIFASHGLFWYGQTTNMWRLTSTYQANVSYKATSHETSLALETLNIRTAGTIVVPPTEKTLRTFTYAYAIQELWRAHHMPGVVLPRLAATGLALFSGVWPHVKLFMLLLTWWFSKHPIRRRRCLASLSVLGKWSLVDVLVVCVMVGVLNLQWTFTARNVLLGIQDNLTDVVSLLRNTYNSEQVCSQALHYSCDHPKKIDHMIECKACRLTVNSWYDHPESAKPILNGLLVEGGGNASLSVAGLEGIYAFCAAVILSILLSVAVDWFDENSSSSSRWGRTSLHHRTGENSEVEEEQQWWLTGTVASNEEDSSEAANPEISGTLSVGGASSAHEADDVLENEHQVESLLHPLLMVERGTRSVHQRDMRSAADLDFDRRILVQQQERGNCIWQTIAWGTAIVVLFATSSVTMERHVNGALPGLLNKILGVVWTKQYSFWLLGWTTAMAGGWDRLLMATFVWFVIVGPLVRSVLCIAASRATASSELSDVATTAVHRRQRRLSRWIDFVGAFCAWEVFTVAVCMVDLLMPSVTSTIIMDQRCAKLAAQTGESTCLEVEFITKRTFGLVVLGGLMLVLVSQRVRNWRTQNS